MNGRQYIARVRAKFRTLDVLPVSTTVNTPVTADVLKHCRGRGIRITDVDNKPLSAPVAVAHGTVTLSGAVLSFSPATGYTGKATFTVGLEDGFQRRFTQVVVTVA